MANYKKSSTGKGIVAAIVAVAVLAVTYVVVSVGLGSYNPADWVNRTEDVTENREGGGAILDEALSNGVRLTSARIAAADYAEYGVSAQAETAYSLVATVYDEEGESAGIPQDVVYSCEWQNPDSEWATGKDISDYYTVTSTGVNTANAECLQAFGEPVVIKATAYFNDEAYTTWTANYVKRVESIELTTSNNTIDGIDNAVTVSVDVTYGVGTVTGELTFGAYRLDSYSSISSVISTNSYGIYFAQQLEDAGIEDWDFDMEGMNTQEITVSDGTIETFGLSIENMFLSYMEPEDVEQIISATNNFEYLEYAFYSAAAQTTNDIRFNIQYSYTYNDEVYSSGMALSPWFELVGNYPQQSTVEGNDIVIVH